MHACVAAGLLEDMDKAQAEYKQYKRLRGLLMSVTEELPDAPLYYNLHDICKTVRCQPPKFEVLRSAIIHAGHRCATNAYCCQHARHMR